MELDSLVQHYASLQQQLAKAYDVVPWQSGTIDQLAQELIAIELQIASLQRPTYVG
jgi:hypothetical protein